MTETDRSISNINASQISIICVGGLVTKSGTVMKLETRRERVMKTLRNLSLLMGFG
jgi:hypothetical protein